MNKATEIQELVELLDELMLKDNDELDEIEMLCGCTGKSCQSNWMSLY